MGSINKYPDYIMQMIRLGLGYEKGDEVADREINNMIPPVAFDIICNHNGLINYGETIQTWIEDIFNVDLDQK